MPSGISLCTLRSAAMMRMPASQVRREFSDTLNKVMYLNEKVTLERHEKPVAVLISIDEYNKLNNMSSKLDSSLKDKTTSKKVKE